MNEYLTHGSILRSKSGELFVLLRTSSEFFSLYSMLNWSIHSTIVCNSNTKTIAKKDVIKIKDLQYISIKPYLIPLQEYLPTELELSYFTIGSLYQVTFKSKEIYHCVAVVLYEDSESFISFFDINGWKFVAKTSNNSVYSEELKNCTFKLLLSRLEIKRIRKVS